MLVIDDENIKNIINSKEFNNLDYYIKSTFLEIISNCNTKITHSTTSGLGDVLLHKIYIK